MKFNAFSNLKHFSTQWSLNEMMAQIYRFLSGAVSKIQIVFAHLLAQSLHRQVRWCLSNRWRKFFNQRTSAFTTPFINSI